MKTARPDDGGEPLVSRPPRMRRAIRTFPGVRWFTLARESVRVPRCTGFRQAAGAPARRGRLM